MICRSFNSKSTFHSNHHRKSQRGQGLTEYLILVALIAVACITVSSKLGAQISFSMAKIAGRLGANVTNIKPETIEAKQVKARDMTDFFKDNAAN